MNTIDGAGLRLAVGLSGAGKTHGIRNDVYRFVRQANPAIVIDRMREWNAVPSDIGRYVIGVRDVKSAHDAIQKGARLAIVAANGIDSDLETEAACAWARDWPGLAGVVLPEAHRALPNRGRLLPAAEDCVTAWRHHRVAMWADTQRIALISTSVVELAYEMKVYAQIGENNLAILRSIGGRELVAAVGQCAERLAAGEPGWHVRLGVVRLPPFVPVRV